MDSQTKKRLEQMELAHKAVMLEDAQGLLSLQREITRQHQSKELGVQLEPKEPDVVHIGDTVHNHTTTEQATPKAAASLLKRLAPVLLTVAGLLAGGVGGAGLVAMMTKAAVAPAMDWPAKEFDIFWKFDGEKFEVEKIKPVNGK